MSGSMHYWPPRGAKFGCDTAAGFRSSAASDVTCPDCRAKLALDDRRQRAREAGLDAAADDGAPLADEGDRLDVAIETATRVRVTDEIINAAASSGRGFGFNLETALKATFEAAGFEVEQ